jgi:alpha-tubulin suppressor-like RCC1 family protein
LAHAAFGEEIASSNTGVATVTRRWVARSVWLRLTALVTLFAAIALAAASAPAEPAPGTRAGQLYAFGENTYGQLGSTTHVWTEAPNPTPTLVTLAGAVGPVAQVAAGTYHSLAVTSSGQLYAFGDNHYGQLGSATDNGTIEPNPTPTLVTLPGEVGPVRAVRRPS